MIELEILNKTEQQTKHAKIKTYKFKMPTEPHSMYQAIGIDPGVVNMAVAILPNYGSVGYAHQLTIPRLDDAVLRIENYGHILTDCGILFSPPIRAVVEGSAFSKGYRQTELAEARTCAVIWLLRMIDQVKIVPPNTIRKDVFRNGAIKAHEFWSGLPEDCLAALSCAYYASDYWEETVEESNLPL